LVLGKKLSGFHEKLENLKDETYEERYEVEVITKKEIPRTKSEAFVIWDLVLGIWFLEKVSGFP
jgi:hypothetical protein